MTEEQATTEVVVPPIAWKTLTCVSLVGFMVSVEITIISLALEEIRSAFPDSSESQLSWIFTAYNIGVAALLLPAGWLANRFGWRNIFVLGVGLFGIGSLLAGLSQSIEMLIASRALQSIGGAFQFPSGLALLLAAFPIEKRQLGIGIWGATGGLAAAAGPTLGALLVEATGWRAVFLINVPVALIITLLGSRWLTKAEAEDSAKGVDLLSVPAASIGIGAIILGIVQTEVWGWTDRATLLCFVVGVALVALFIVRSMRHAAPLFDLSLFRIRSFTIGILGQTAFVAAFFAWLVPLPTFLRTVWGWSVLTAGFAIAPGPLVAMVVAPVAGRIADTAGPRVPLMIGGLCGAVGVAIQLVALTTTPSYLVALLIPGIFVGVAAGVGFSGSVGAIMRDIAPRHFSMAGAARQTMVQLTLALTIAIAFTIIGRPESSDEFLDVIRVTWVLVAVLFFIEFVLFAWIYPQDQPEG